MRTRKKIQKQMTPSDRATKYLSTFVFEKIEDAIGNISKFMGVSRILTGVHAG
jgi:hypothetical protein